MWIFNRKPVPINSIMEPSACTIKGEIVQYKDFIIPALNISCIYYSCLVESFIYGPMRKSRRMWFPVTYREGIETFFIDDGTGRVLVVPDIKKTHIYNVPVKVIYSGATRYLVYLLKAGDTVKIRGLCIQDTPPSPSCLYLIPPENRKINIHFLKHKSA